MMQVPKVRFFWMNISVLDSDAGYISQPKTVRPPPPHLIISSRPRPCDAKHMMAFCCFMLMLDVPTKARSLYIAPRSIPRPRAVRQLPVVVVGGGLAGLAASIEASRAGAPVILMEKGNRIGGNSAKATSGRFPSARALFCRQTSRYHPPS